MALSTCLPIFCWLHFTLLLWGEMGANSPPDSLEILIPRLLLLPLLASQSLSTTPTPSPCFSGPIWSFPQLAKSQKFLAEDGPRVWLSWWRFSGSVYSVISFLGAVLEGPLTCKLSHLYFSLNWKYRHAHKSRSLGISCSFPGKSTDLVDSGRCGPGKTECMPLFSF